jgi:UDP-glucose 4-epimerase
MSHPAALNEDFNISAAEELTVAAIARIVWEACGRPADEFELRNLPAFEVDVARRWPSVAKAKRLLGWEARIGVREGIEETMEWLRERLELVEPLVTPARPAASR